MADRKTEMSLVTAIHDMAQASAQCASDMTRKRSERVLHAVRARTLDEIRHRITDTLGLPDTLSPVGASIGDSLPTDVRIDSLIPPSRR